MKRVKMRLAVSAIVASLVMSCFAPVTKTRAASADDIDDSTIIYEEAEVISAQADETVTREFSLVNKNDLWGCILAMYRILALFHYYLMIQRS